MRVLILGGTTEAVELGELVSQLDQVEVFVSLAGRTKNPKISNLNTRIGGFGGIGGLRNYLQQMQIEAVIDATHPFAAQISTHVAIAAQQCHIPHLILVRPAWEKQPGDNWIEVESIEQAAEILGNVGQRVFLTIGRQEISTFAGLEKIWFLMRMIDPPTGGEIPRGEIILDRGPFTWERDRDLLLTHDIDHIVSKNSGGDATYGKIIAARELNIPVIMVKRPPVPESVQVATVGSAVNWLIDLISQR
ncbi:cobalt-precorrin-6A reductase [Calothrix sp. NIES-3974]|uniref:cobalt-precorrin-6A reductase n=1 Tax=Calothrix sp. NIES-3974 TaxID=2005462 RepID=UPI000B5FF036|nr:cobalt-precorrin-6A reductase [Calothrix sp. NIES-3974]BAZ05330.1 precorrin-6x reductase [Calothrix sp. NIES-3974]